MSAAEKSFPAARESGLGAAGLLLILLSDPLQALQVTGLIPALTGLHQHFGSSGGIFGVQMLMSMPGLGIVLAGWPAGRLVERFGPMPLLAAALPAYALSGAAGLAIDTLPGLLLSRFLLGCSTACIAGAALSLVSESRVKSRLLSWQASLGALAGLLSLPPAGWLAETYGWRGPLLLYLLALLAWPAALSRARLEPRRPTMRQAAAVVSSRRLWPGLLAATLVFTVVFMRSTHLPFLLAESGLVRPTEQAWTLTLECLLAALGALAFSGVISRVAPRMCLALCLLGMGLGNLLLSAGGMLPLQLAGMVVSAAAAGFGGPCLAYLVLERAGPALRQRASGLLFTAIYLGDFINPMPTALLRHAFGLDGVFAGAGLACLIAGAAVVWHGRRRPA